MDAKNNLYSFLTDIATLGKPRMWLAIAITILPGLLIGKQWPPFGLVFATIAGTSLIAISSFIFNQIWEIEKDLAMKRTANRPLPSRRISAKFAVLTGFLLLICGSFILVYFSGILPAILAIASFTVYIFLYTILLKPRTTLNTLIGGFSGAVGPLIGEAAVHQELSITGAAMFGLLFIWQPPHFWVLAIRYKDDYKAAGLKMLPVVQNLNRVYLNILGYQLLLILYIVLITFIFPIFSIYLFAIPNIITGLLVWIFMFQLYRKNESHKTMGIFYATIVQMLLWHVSICIELLI